MIKMTHERGHLAGSLDGSKHDGASEFTDDAEKSVQEFFDRFADHYERSWDLEEHGLHVGIFDRPCECAGPGALERAFQRCRDHVIDLLEKVRPFSSKSKVLDVCCGTGVTLAQLAERHECIGLGVDISPAQISHARKLLKKRRAIDPERVDFRVGSASRLGDVIKSDGKFTHCFSQDGLLFVQNRERALSTIHSALEEGGALVISDFVPLMSKESIEAAVRARVYEDVKWKEGLGFQEYIDLLGRTGFEIVQAELRPMDMRTTYALLAPRTNAFIDEGDEVYSFLAKRYQGIVAAIDAQALSWGWFVGRKV